LAEFCVALPHAQKISNGWTRLVMRRAMAGILPEEISWRSDKVDFFRSLIYGIVSTDETLLDAALRACQKAVENYVESEVLNTRFRRFLAKPMENDPSALWPVFSLGLWLDRSGLSS